MAHFSQPTHTRHGQAATRSSPDRNERRPMQQQWIDDEIAKVSRLNESEPEKLPSLNGSDNLQCGVERSPHMKAGRGTGTPFLRPMNDDEAAKERAEDILLEGIKCKF